MVRRLALHLGCCALALAAASPARAQVATDPALAVQPGVVADQRIVYTPLDFAQYAPRTALDMVQQVPGFNIQDGGGQGRGLGQASGNVLINGERISSKSDSITQRLSRIAAANVIRIEFVEGSTLNIPGLSGRVANIVTSRTAGVRGQFEWTPQLATDYSTMRWAAGRISVTGSAGRVAYTLAADNSPFHGGTGGPNVITFASGFVEERFNTTQSVMHNPKLSTQLRIDGPGSSLANLSASYQWSWNRSQEDEVVVAPPGSPSRLREIRNRGDGNNYEIGGDFEFALGPGRLKLIGLESYRESDFSTQAETDPDTGAPRFGTRFTQDSRSGERIARGEYRWNMLGGDWQLSGEAAFNRLDNLATLSVLMPSGEFAPVAFPAGTGGVREDRYESILSFGRPLSANLSMQLSVGGEYSNIAQTGSNALSRTFTRPKGSFTLAWAAREGLDLSFKATRRVGQLNFGDFLADVNLSNNNVNAGNNQLRPQQAWEFELEAAQDLGQWGSLTLVLFDHEIEDYVTIVPLPGGGESVGNVDSARAYGVRLNSTIRLDPLGFNGARLDIDGQLRKSRLADPVTGVVRYFDRAQPRSINLQFRHDVPQSHWAWGSNFRTSEVKPYFRLAEEGMDYNLRTAFGVFVEHKDVFGLTVQARLNNILEQDSVLDRTIYAGPRNSAPILFREDRRREIGRIVNFVVRGNF